MLTRINVNNDLSEVSYCGQGSHQRPCGSSFFRSKIAVSASSWLDDYFSWVAPNGQASCCRMKYMKNETCFSSTVKPPGGNSTTPVPKMICYNKTLPVSPHVFCNATGQLLYLYMYMYATVLFKLVYIQKMHH